MYFRGGNLSGKGCCLTFMDQRMDSAELLKLAIAGDNQAFHTLFAGFEAQLRSYLYRLLTDREDVNDLAQDTFIQAFTRLATFKQESSLKTWVFKIATNLAYDHLRRRKRWQPDAQDRAADLAISSERSGRCSGGYMIILLREHMK